MTSSTKKTRLSARKTSAQSFTTQRPNTFKLKPLPNSLMLALAGGLFIQAGFALAQDAKPATENNVTLQSVTVTAQKREEKAQDVATAITVLGGSELQDKDIGKSAGEVLNFVPNASAGTQQNGRPRWWIRGVGAGQQQIDFPNPVGFYRDDVYISNATATGFPLFDLERVEVLRGPQGTLWGKNTTGGAINVISKKPSFKSDGYIKADYGSYDNKILQGAVGGAIKEDALAGRLSVYVRDQGEGRFNNLYTGQKDGSLSDSNIRGQITALVSDKLTVNAALHYREYKTKGATTTVASYAGNGVYRNGYVPSTNTNDVSTNSPAWSNIIQTGGQINIQYDLGRYSLTAITGFEDFSTESLTDSDNTPLEISRGWAKGKSQQFSQEVRLASPKADKTNWVSGVHYFTEDVNSKSASARLPNGSVSALTGSTAPTTFRRAEYDHKTSSFGIFGSLTHNFTNKFSTTTGARWTTETKSLNLTQRQFANGSVNVSDAGQWWDNTTGTINSTVSNNNFTSTPKTTWNAFTYDITPEYKIADNARTFFKYSHGVKSGGYNSTATDVRALNTLKPETLDAYEIGFKSELFNRKVNLNANVFHYDYRDVQVNITGLFNGNPNQTVAYLQNVEKAHVNGAELEVEAKPTERWYFKGSLGYLDTGFDKFDIQNSGGNRNNNKFVRSPRKTGIFLVDYSYPLSNGSKLVAGYDIRYTSKQYFYVDPQSSDRELLNQAGYSVSNLRLNYLSSDKKHNIGFYVNNLGDKQYKNHTLTSFVAGTTNGDSIIWGARRTYGINYTYKF